MKLIFVYNAESDFISKTLDFAHKIISPTTYQCDLCALTHDNFGEKKAWKEFRENHKVAMEFLYKSEFEKRYFKTEYPALYIEANGEFELIISPKQFKKVDDVQGLIQIVDSCLRRNDVKKIN